MDVCYNLRIQENAHPLHFLYFMAEIIRISGTLIPQNYGKSIIPRVI